MNRREFVRLTGSGMTMGAIAEQVVSAAGRGAAARSRRASLAKARMKAGTQHGDSDAILRVHGRLRRQPHLQPAAVARSSTPRGRSSR